MSVDTATPTEVLRRTPLFALHVELGARMVPFAGYEMPVQYQPGVLKEHLHTREAAGLFDVSHMGQIVLRAKSGDVRDAALALETLVPVDIVGLEPGRVRYAFFTTAQGGILDDLMVANFGDHLLLVVNASRQGCRRRASPCCARRPCEIDVLDDRALIALQGPRAECIAGARRTELHRHAFHGGRARLTLLGCRLLVSRSGYTGEDGFEISIPADMAREIAEELLANEKVAPIGLGARNSLRLEAGLCLYGADIDESTTPVEAGLSWAMQKVRRTGGARAGGFPGAEIILEQLASGAPRRRVGLKPEGRAPVRAGAPLYADESGTAAIGAVTSGGFGPSLAAPVAMGLSAGRAGRARHANFRGAARECLPATVRALPFIAPTYKRG